LIVLRSRMIMDFVDDHQTKARAAVKRTEGRRELRHELFLTCAVEVAPEAHALGGAAEMEAVAVTGEVRLSVAEEKEHFVTAQTKGKTAVGPKRWVEARLVHQQESTRRKEGVCRKAKFHRYGWVVGEKPAAEVHSVRRGIKAFHRVQAR